MMGEAMDGCNSSPHSFTPNKPATRWTKFEDPLFRALSTTPDRLHLEGSHLDDLYSETSQSASTTTSPTLGEQENKSKSNTDWTHDAVSSWDAFQVVKPAQKFGENTESARALLRAPTSGSIVVELPESTLANPISIYDGFNPGAPILKESEAVKQLFHTRNHQSSDSNEFMEFELSEFTIYLDNSLYPSELRPLHHLATRAASDKFFFDGVLSVGDKRFFVKKVPFRELPIGNYDVEDGSDGEIHHSVDDQIWIRSEINQKQELYYKLRKPSPEYRRFWAPFRWIADLAKHVIDYCFYLIRRKRRARLDDFRISFATHIAAKHNGSQVFQRWYVAHGSHDFRTAVAANIEYIWKEAFGLPSTFGDIITWHSFWSEISGNYYVPMMSPAYPLLEDDGTIEDSATSDGGAKRNRTSTDVAIAKTIVTPYIFDLFSHMGFESIMQSTTPAQAVHNSSLQQQRDTSTAKTTLHKGTNQYRDDGDSLLNIEVGDVISTPPDNEETGTKWKRESSKHHDINYIWYGMVQAIHVSSKGRRSFDVVWMYQPRDTPCALMKYPWPNELFLSDTCTCETARVEENDVIGTHRIAWFADPTSCASDELFVRQIYLTTERCWVSLHENHLTCSHHKKNKHIESKGNYQEGDTVLARPPSFERLDAFIVESIYRKDRKRWARLRQLVRRSDLDTTKPCPLNELVYSDQFVEIEFKRITRPCMIRCFRPDEEIPCPYNRGGTGDAFYYTHRLGLHDQLVPIENTKMASFRQGFIPGSVPSASKLRGLDLFCGGGNFGRGLEDGGAVEMKWANDISSNAIHSYMANCSLDNCQPFLGSIDDLFKLVLQGHPDVPKPGDVQFISGGSPCQGFSRLTKVADQKAQKQIKNRSLVASFASFVDIYRPQYGLLENVPSMVKAQDKRESCFFSQLVCAIVGLGYQVRIVYADAWTYGAPQMRSRVFLSFAAPGVKMPKAPAPTHSHPPRTRMGSLGRMSNGQPFGERVHSPAPFKFVSSLEATQDLPDIRDAKADYCLGFPDHRLSIGYTPRIRHQVLQIPIQPHGMSFEKAYFGYDEDGRRNSGSLSTADRDFFFPNSKELRVQPGSKGWGRVHPHGLFRTVVTSCGPTDNRTGYVNHWQQPRPLTVLEVRRAQGFLDHEVITGGPRQQWHVVGNSVARQVALALGLAIREAWFGTLKENFPATAVTTRNSHKVWEYTNYSKDTNRLGEVDEDNGMVINYQELFSEALNESVSTPASSISDPPERGPSLVCSKELRRKRTSREITKRQRLG